MKSKNNLKRIAMMMAIMLILSVIAVPISASYAMASEKADKKVTEEKAHDDMVLMNPGAADEWAALTKEGVQYADIYEDFCKTWTPDGTTDVFTAKDSSVYDAMEKGTYWKMRDCFVYVPKEADANTKFLVYFAGGSGGWILRQDYPQTYLKQFQPNAVMVFYKSGFIYDRLTLHDRTVEIWKAASDELGVAPQDVVVAGSSNGGYTALTVAANLVRDYNIRVDKVLILDMGNLWMKSDVMLSKEDAQPMVKDGTTVYAFSKKDNIYKTSGSLQWLSYGVNTKEVCCPNWDHDGISKMALRNSTFSWAIGERSELEPEWYTVREIHKVDEPN